MFKRSAQRHVKPGIFIELAPTGEGEASAWLQRCAQIDKSAARLREKHDAKARKKEIESGRFEPVGRRVSAHEFDRGARRQPLSSARQHRRRNVNAQHLSGRPGALGERDRTRTSTAADIDNTLALPQLRSLQRCLQDRTQDDVLRLLAFDPMAATSAIQ
jgi:hypothetical protein